MGACEEIGPRRMETDCLNDTFRLRKGPVRARSSQTMYHDLACGLDIVSHSREVVSLWMPNQFANNVLELHLDGLGAWREAVFHEGPADKLLLQLIGFGVDIVLGFPLCEFLAELLRAALRVQFWLEDVNVLCIGHSKEALFLRWAPFDSVDDFRLYFVFSQNASRPDLPNNDIVILVTRCQVVATG